jgi:hypothetical protein
MSRMRIALALTFMAFTMGVSFLPHPADAMIKLQTCEPKGDYDPDDGDPEHYNCHPDAN